MKINEIGEFGLISLLSGQLPPLSDRVVKGIGDDTAVLTAEQGLTLMTTDMLVQDVHFSFRYSSHDSIGWKALAVNVSDIAAMGGLPLHATVALGIPPQWEVSKVEELYGGLSKCARTYGIDIVGGDTVKCPGGLVINVTLLGKVEPERVIYRSNAKPGDVIMVTGPLGNSAAGLYILNHELLGLHPRMREEVIDAHFYPQARLMEGRLLTKMGHINSMNDISDGLASEVMEICQASNTGCEIVAENIPYSEAVAEISKRAEVDPVHWALFGGEDFELVFTLSPEMIHHVSAALKEAGCAPAVVGRVTNPNTGCVILQNNHRADLHLGGFNHFRD